MAVLPGRRLRGCARCASTAPRQVLGGHPRRGMLGIGFTNFEFKMNESETSENAKNGILTLFYATAVSVGLWWLPYFLSEKVGFGVNIFDPLSSLAVGIVQFYILFEFIKKRIRKNLGLNIVLTVIAIIVGRGFAILAFVFYWVDAQYVD